MKRVLCDATADKVEGGGFLVTVTGVGEHADTVRNYTIEADEEGPAAREGIARFVREMGGDA